MDAKTMAARLTHQPNDRSALQKLVGILEAMPEAELERFYRSSFNVLTVANVIFERRFPEAYARVDAEICGDDAPMKM